MNNSQANPKVSIVIPVYNVAPYIWDCMQSVMRQTYNCSMECLIVDDCGTDDSITIIERTIAAYTGPISFKIIHHEQNKGLSAARNTGTLCAKGDYIYYLDSDDIITNDCIEKLMKVVSLDSAVEMVQGNAKSNINRHFDSLNKKYSIQHATTNKEIRECFYKYHQLPSYAWNKLIKRSFLLQNQLLFKDGLLWEDKHWLFFLLKKLCNVYFISDTTYLYRIRNNSIVTSTSKETFAKHRAIFYYDVLTNLTPLDEKSEMKCILMEFAHFYSQLNDKLQEYQEIFSLFLEKSKTHSANGIKIKLEIFHILGEIKGGWLIIEILRRLQFPELVLLDARKFINK